MEKERQDLEVKHERGAKERRRVKHPNRRRRNGGAQEEDWRGRGVEVLWVKSGIEGLGTGVRLERWGPSNRAAGHNKVSSRCWVVSARSASFRSALPWVVFVLRFARVTLPDCSRVYSCQFVCVREMIYVNFSRRCG
jgi:hypothetical protein